MDVKTRRRLALLAAALWLGLCLVATLSTRRQQPAADYAVKVDAAQRLEGWMAAVKEYKREVGLTIPPEDILDTGMLGESYTAITTTNGAVEAKRTTADPNMAALLVQMLTEAGVRSGDTVGAGFSGSFPALDLAVLAACEAMGVRCVYIASVGASTYGANQPEMTLPDMVCRLYQDGLLQTPPALVTPGGEDDCGLDMDGALLEEILTRIQNYGVEIMEEPDFAANLERRMALYAQEGPISCFVGVGGNLTTSGLGESQVDWGVILPNSIETIAENSGLLQRYNVQGLPVLHLLNIKRLVADYQLPYDPQTVTPIGESAVYRETVYSRLPALLGVAGAVAVLVGLRRKGAQG